MKTDDRKGLIKNLEIQNPKSKLAADTDGIGNMLFFKIEVMKQEVVVFYLSSS